MLFHNPIRLIALYLPLNRQNDLDLYASTLFLIVLSFAECGISDVGDLKEQLELVVTWNRLVPAGVQYCRFCFLEELLVELVN